MSFFSRLEEIPPDAIFGLSKAFLEDKNPNKVDLTVGIYYNKELKPEILSCVKKAEKALCDLEQTKTYLPIDGDQIYLEGTQRVLFGDDLMERFGSSIYSAQTVGGTGALTVAAQMLKQHLTQDIYLPQPTWPNHLKVFQAAGFKIKTYPYYDTKKHRCDFDSLLETLKKLKKKSAVLFHGCCHNPTGKDLTIQQWKELSNLILKKKLIPVFDIAYQGFGSSLEEDAFAVRYFMQQHHEFFVCYSYSKIFGLYAERVGALFIVSQDPDLKKVIATNVKPIIRANYSNPPKHGAQVVSYVLHHENLKKLWLEELMGMRSRIGQIRHDFCQSLCQKSKKKDFSYIQHLKGLFCLTGLDRFQVKHLMDEYGIYMTYDGRLNLTGINDTNIEYVSDAIAKI